VTAIAQPRLRGLYHQDHGFCAFQVDDRDDVFVPLAHLVPFLLLPLPVFSCLGGRLIFRRRGRFRSGLRRSGML
jgi:hypothetical protein